jgi:hypothetical protein
MIPMVPNDPEWFQKTILNIKTPTSSTGNRRDNPRNMVVLFLEPLCFSRNRNYDLLL